MLLNTSILLRANVHSEQRIIIYTFTELIRFSFLLEFGQGYWRSTLLSMNANGLLEKETGADPQGS